MKKFSIMMVAVLSIAAFSGCKKKKDGEGDTAAAGASCATAVAKGMEIHGADLGKMAPPEKVGELTALLTKTALASCNEDKWPAEAISCMSGAADKAAMDACDKKFPAVDEAMKKRMDGMKDEMMKIMMPAGAPPMGDKPADPAMAPAGDKPADAPK